MTQNIHLERDERENNLSVMRRFRDKVKKSGILKKKKKDRFFARTLSHFKKHQNKLMRLKKKEAYDRLSKLGKLPN